MRYLLILLIFISCKDSNVKVVEKYPDGSPLVTFTYPNSSDNTSYIIKVFYRNGAIKKILPAKSDQFVNQIYSYAESGKIVQIDSLKEPCDTNTRACDAVRTIFYDNGKVAERFIMQNGEYNGISQHYDHNGILVKEYSLVNNIKNGPYKEYDDSGNLAFYGTFKNDTLIGNCYFFNSGDTVKYYYNENGMISFPYKKWLNHETTLVGNYASKEKKSVLWTWYKNGAKIKSKLVISRGGDFTIPE